MNKEKIIPFFAIAVLLVAMASTVYVQATQSQYSSSDNIIIDDVEYDLDQFFDTITPITVTLDDEEKTGIPLAEMIISTGVTCPSCHNYFFIASDGYQQTVTWENMESGIFTEEQRVYFPGLAHSFWVRDVIEIEVK